MDRQKVHCKRTPCHLPISFPFHPSPHPDYMVGSVGREEVSPRRGTLLPHSRPAQPSRGMPHGTLSTPPTRWRVGAHCTLHRAYSVQVPAVQAARLTQVGSKQGRRGGMRMGAHTAHARLLSCGREACTLSEAARKQPMPHSRCPACHDDRPQCTHMRLSHTVLNCGAQRAVPAGG